MFGQPRTAVRTVLVLVSSGEKSSMNQCPGAEPSCVRFGSAGHGAIVIELAQSGQFGPNNNFQKLQRKGGGGGGSSVVFARGRAGFAECG